ncbi:hypothetical protein [Stenotrophomonas maltophilia]|uniref:hypothetical protein n=1 Tax=Stenotrophomonas maltophilia TaxID=40324 RepID=UPI003F839597
MADFKPLRGNPALVILALLFAALLVANNANAEGRCPAGQYPIGDQGVGGCAPIPGAVPYIHLPLPPVLLVWILLSLIYLKKKKIYPPKITIMVFKSPIPATPRYQFTIELTSSQ